VPSLYLLIGGLTRPANYVGDLLDGMRARYGEGRSEADHAPVHPAE
jgi:hypothetical protein